MNLQATRQVLACIRSNNGHQARLERTKKEVGQTTEEGSKISAAATATADAADAPAATALSDHSPRRAEDARAQVPAYAARRVRQGQHASVCLFRSWAANRWPHGGAWANAPCVFERPRLAEKCVRCLRHGRLLFLRRRLWLRLLLGFCSGSPRGLHARSICAVLLIGYTAWQSIDGSGRSA